jgi:hypothetical protein
MFPLAHVALPDLSIHVLAVWPVADAEILIQRDVQSRGHTKEYSMVSVREKAGSVPHRCALPKASTAPQVIQQVDLDIPIGKDGANFLRPVLG